MSTAIGVMGQSGHGKTTSMRTLDPATTFYIDADRKGLSWKGWRHQYKEGKNYVRTSDQQEIRNLLHKINDGAKIKTVVIDTANGIMVDDEMARMKENGYDKWAELSMSIYDLINLSNNMRDDLVVVWCFHAEDMVDDNGIHFVHFLTSGRKLQKLVLESKFPIVLLARAKDGEYVFETQARNSSAKTPMGMFEDLDIPNDMGAVVKALRAYEVGDPVHQAPVQETPKASAGDTLVELMAEAGISNAAVVKYCVEKGWLKNGQKISDVPEQLAEAMVKPENWSKVKDATAAKKEEKPAEEKPAEKEEPLESEEGAFHAGLYKLMEMSGITKEALKAYLLDKKYITTAQTIDNLPETFVNQMTTDANWSKVVEAIKESNKS